MNYKCPPPLKPGDTIGLVTPSSPMAACRLFLRNLPGHPSPRQGQKQATSMPPAALAVLVPLDYDPPSGLKIYAPQ